MRLSCYMFVLLSLSSSVVIADTSRTWEQVALGGAHTCGILKNKEVLCWGHNYSGQLGLGRESIEETETRPQRLNITENPKEITLSGSHSCVLLEDNIVKCWGENRRALLGDGLYRLLGPKILDLADNPKTIIMGETHACMTFFNGQAKCWGNNFFGQLGSGTTSPSSIPVRVNINDSIKQIAIGNLHSCMLTDSGEVRCWGSNYFGQLGFGVRDHTAHMLPQTVNLGGQAKQISLGL